MLERARKIVEQLGVMNFNVTNNWLEEWKKDYNVKQMAICWVSGDVLRSKLSCPGKEDCLRFSRVTRKKISTTFMKQGASGRLYMKADLAKGKEV